MKTLSKMCIISISITCVLTLPAKYSDHSPIVDTINRLQEIKGENLLKLNSGKWSSVTSSTHFVATTPENKKSGNVMVPVIIGSIFGGIVALYLIYLLLLLSVVTWTCIFQRFNFHHMLSLLSEENPWKNKLDILLRYTMKMLFYLLQLFVYIAIRAFLVALYDQTL